jgi:DNA-binding transcriptional LysR family regulator
MVAGEGTTRLTEGGAASAPEPSTHQLRSFLALSEELHFGRAAASLFITQPALSQQIRSLEKRLGVELFERNSRAVTLTSVGRELLPEARSVVEAMARLQRSADAAGRHLSGRLKVGTLGAEAAMPYTVAILQTVQNRHPGLVVQLVNLNFVNHLAALQRQEVDVVFLRPPVPDGIEVLHLATEPRVACIPSSDPLAALPQVTVGQLAEHPVVDVPPQASRVWWDFWAVDPRPDGTPVRYGPVVTDMEALLHTVAQGDAMSFLPAAARDFFPRPGVSYLDVVDLPPCTSALAWATENHDKPVIAAVRQAARSLSQKGA